MTNDDKVISETLPHIASYRVYYEDTDAGRVVYHSRYLNFAERARTDFLRDKGLVQSHLIEKLGVIFVVKESNVRFKSPARLDDLISVSTQVVSLKGASMVMKQVLSNADNGDIVFSEIVSTIVCANIELKPVRIPKDVLDAMGLL